jgi:hypothetical protein
MLKRLLVAAAFVVVAGSMVGVSNVKNASAASDKVTICHRTNSVTNPYTSPSVSFDAATGVLKDNGQGDHTSHTGPVWDANTAYPTPHNGDQWGDIIPPYTWPGDKNHPGGSYDGLNWTEEGRAIYDNDCKVSAINFDVVCDVVNHKAVITFTNTSKKTYKKASVNGESVQIPTGSTVVEVPTAVNGTQITIVINKVTVYDKLVTCEPGKGAGGETPTTPEVPATPAATAPAASLPFTANNTPVVALVASAIATVTAVVSVIVKSALVKQL